MSMSGPLEKVLLVEDDPAIRMVAATALELMGSYTVRPCASAAEALACIAEFEPQLILSDVILPEMTGPQMMQRLRKQRGSACAPVIFMTAGIQPAELEGLLQLAPLGVIAKPFDPMLLPGQIAGLWQSRNG